jgi:O-antigen/teichoic acid export membrane protein
MAESDQRTLNILAKAAGITAIGMFISKFISYLYRTVIARFVGPEAYGTLSLGIMVVSLGITISIFALGSAIQNYIPKYREKGNKEAVKGVISSAFRFSLPLSIVVSIAMYTLSDWIALSLFNSPGLVQILKIFAFVPPFAVISTLSLSTTKAFKTARYDVLVRRIFQNIVQLIAAVALIGLGFGIAGAAAGWLIGAIAAALIGFYYMEYKIGPFLLSSKSKETNMRKMLRFSYPLVMAGAIGTILGWTDTAFIGYFMEEESVGFYNAALPTAMLIMMPYQALATLAMPSMSEVMESKEKDLEKVLKTLTRWTFMISFPMFILMALFSDQVLHILFGGDYTSAALSLTILTFGYLYSTSVGHLDTVLKAMDKTKLLFKNSLINFFVNIGLNLLLIPKFGIAGGAAATAISIIFAESLLLAEVYYFKGVHPFSIESLKPIIASTPALIIVYLGLNHLFETIPLWASIPGGLAFGTIYLITLYIINGIKEDELNIIKNTVDHLKNRIEALI